MMRATPRPGHVVEVCAPLAMPESVPVGNFGVASRVFRAC
jgi:hypothetical protein